MQEKVIYRAFSALSSRGGETARLYELRAQMVAPTRSLLLLLLVGQRSLHYARGIFTVGKLMHIILHGHK